MKKIPCKMCGNSTFYCRSGDHKKTPGRIHSGRGALMDGDWPCPNCTGVGFIEVSFLDGILVSIYNRMVRINRRVYPQ